MTEYKETKSNIWKHPLTITLIAGIFTLLAVIITPLVNGHADVTALCSTSAITGKVFSESYVDKLSGKIEKANEKAKIADQFVNIVNAIRDRDQTKPFPPRTPSVYFSVFDDPIKDYQKLGSNKSEPPSEYEKTQGQVSGEMKCRIENTGSQKAGDIEITYPAHALALFVQDKAISFEPDRPSYKLTSLNPGDSFTVVAQYGGYFRSDEYAPPPSITYADGTSKILVERPYHGYAAAAASFVTIMHDIGWVLVILVVVVAWLISFASRQQARATSTASGGDASKPSGEAEK